MPDFYLDEHPKPQEPSQWGTDTTDGSGGGGGGGGGSGGAIGGIAWGGGAGGGGGGSGGEPSTPNEWPEPEEPWYLVSSWKHSQTEVLLNGEDFIQACGPWILKGDKGCMELVVKAQIQGDSGGSHVRCILLSFSMSGRSEIAGDPFEWLFGKIPVINGTMTLRAKWQAGHWPYDSIHTARFKLLSTDDDGVISPWMKLPLAQPYIDIACIDVVHGQLILNSLRVL